MSPGAVRAFKITAAVTVLAMVALIGWALWAANRPEAKPDAPAFDRFQPAWSSAMAKAGVEASFPAGPVELGGLRVRGRRSFEATFTAEEISSLLNVYRHTTRMAGSDLAILAASVDFSDPKSTGLRGRLVVDGQPYEARARAVVRFDRGVTMPGLESLEVEGFNVGGAKKRQAGELVLEYFNDYLENAPGLTVETAERVDGGVYVVGFAPASIEVSGGENDGRNGPATTN